MSVRQHFIHFDADRTGSLDYNELFQAITSAGFRLDMPPFYELCKTFDPDRSGALNMASYLALCALLKSAGNVFRSFDPRNQGRIMLDFNQFIYASAFIR